MSELIHTTDSNAITRAYFDSVLIEMRHIGNEKPDLSIELFGEKFDTPIMTAALSHLNKCHPEGLAEQARGAKLANAVNWAGMGDEEELDRICATGARTIKIIKPYEDEEVIYRKIRHAEAAGCMAVGMDLDHSFHGDGEYDVVLGLPMRPKTVEQLKSYAAATKLPFIIKGVLSASDAKKCVEAGMGGIVVSHHHGIIPSATPPLMMLPEIVKAVDGAFPIFMDCGIESGADAFKALLGATAVSIGRCTMEPLTRAGAEGVRDKILEVTRGVAGIMARTGSATVKGIDPTVVKVPKIW